MSRQNRNAGARRDRTNLYSEITDKILADLEAGRVPWVQPWGTAAANAPVAMPKNAATGRRYSGINVLLLWGAVIDRGFAGQNWLTFRQALSLGGNVRKGERGTTVVYADRFVPEDEKRRAAEIGEDAQAIPFLKRFTVFNTDQCEGLPKDVAASAPGNGEAVPDGELLPHVTAVWRWGMERHVLHLISAGSSTPERPLQWPDLAEGRLTPRSPMAQQRRPNFLPLG